MELAKLPLAVTEKTNRATPFLQVILMHKKGEITLESAFSHFKEFGVLRPEVTYTDFLDTLCAVAYSRIMPSVPIILVEKAIITAQKEQNSYLKQKKYLKGKSNVSKMR